MNWLTLLGLLLTAAIGVWRFFASQARRQRQRAEEAAALGEEGFREHDASKITAAFDRLRRP